MTAPDRGLAGERTALAWRRSGLSLVTAGLAIVKGIVAAHGGDVLVTSTEGAGSTFMFTLPVAQHAPSVG